jgi:membrane-associated phospholipid phosphatase
MRTPLHDTTWLLRVAASAAIATAISLVLIDEPVVRAGATRDAWPAAWNFVIGIGEYAIGIEPWKWLGVCVLAAGVIATRVVPRWHAHATAWLFVAATHLVARNVMLWGKHLTGRLRPTEWHVGPTFFQHGGSFPSGHVMLFGSLLLPLAVLYPRARLACSIAIAFVMIARIATRAHFISDVTAGLALTALVTWACAAAIPRLPWPTPPASPR